MATTPNLTLPDVLKNDANFLAIAKEIQNQRNAKYNSYPLPFPTFEGRFANIEKITANLKLIADNEAKISNYNEKLIPEALVTLNNERADLQNAYTRGNETCEVSWGKGKSDKCQAAKKGEFDAAQSNYDTVVNTRNTLIATNQRLDKDNQGYIAQNLGIINTILAEAKQWVISAQAWVDTEQAAANKQSQHAFETNKLLREGLLATQQAKVQLWQQAQSMGATIDEKGNVVQDKSKMQNNIFIGVAVAVAIGLGIYLFKGNN